MRSIFNTNVKSKGFLPFLFVLASCGGSSDEAGSYTPTTAVKTYSTLTPSSLTSYPSQGVASTTSAPTDFGLVKSVFAPSSSSFTIFDGYDGQWEPFGPKAHLIDVEVNSAWSDGWTGKGVNISVIDDFTTNRSKYFSTTIPYIRKKTTTYTWGNFDANYSVAYKYFETTSHGHWVANIAGGDYASTPITENINYDVNSDAIVIGSCNSRSTSQFHSAPACDTKYHNSWYSYSGENINVTRTRKLIPGIAGEALVTKNNVNLSSSQNPVKTVSDIQGHLKNSASYDVINLSLGSEVPTTGRTFNEVMATVEQTPLLSKSSAVITVAAGNGGAPCSNDDLGGCNAVAVALSFQDATKEATIVVGALTGSGLQENIATYSTRAGILANRFILAQGTIGFWDSVAGTSFAAPRVAGVAAILKHKYPSLTAKQISDIILLSASKDINNDGLDDFTGISPIYGHGKLSLRRALSFAGSI